MFKRFLNRGIFPKVQFHCISRTAGQKFLFFNHQQTKFMQLMREYEDFCQVRIVTFNILSNHFHLVVEVTEKPEIMPNDEQLARIVAKLTGRGANPSLGEKLKFLRSQGNHEAAEALRQRYFGCMWNVSVFMKLLKQRFSRWYNMTHKRKGTLWEGPFRSTMTMGGTDLVRVSTYVDNNNVRNGTVREPHEYEWCGYAQAVRGEEKALAGLKIAVAELLQVPESSLSNEQTLTEYRKFLYEAGEEKGIDEQGRPIRKGISRERVAEIVAKGGRVDEAEFNSLTVRYYSYGGCFGPEEKVNRVLDAHRALTPTPRKTGARRMRGLKAKVYVIRDLRKDVFR